MQAPPLPNDEPVRLRKLRELGLLDSFPDARFDRVTRIARRLFDAPIALISLIDDQRQWFKSSLGLELRETPRDISFCAHAILGEAPMVVTDTFQDTRFASNPWVLGEPRIRFYAGCPLHLHGGSALGTLAVMDTRPRAFPREDLGALRDLGDMIEHDLLSIEQALSDEVTGLVNRRGFHMLGHQALRMCARAGAPAVIALFELEPAPHGDVAEAEAQRQFARLLHQAFRASDVVGRLGEREFVALATHATLAEMRRIAGRLQGALRADAASQAPPPAAAAASAPRLPGGEADTLRGDGYRVRMLGFHPDAETQIGALLGDWH